MKYWVLFQRSLVAIILLASLLPLSASAAPVRLPGAYAIMTTSGGYRVYFTAVGGGGRTADAIHVDAGKVSAWERFTILRDGGQVVFQTANGHYLTAVGGGGQPRGTNGLHTDATKIGSWERFTLVDQNDGTYAIRTANGHYLTAGPGYWYATDRTQPSGWERFYIVQVGDPGSGSVYSVRTIQAKGMSLTEPGGNDAGTFFTASGGGGADQAISFFRPKAGTYERFHLLKQPDGNYALQTPSGNYVTANGVDQKNEIFLNTDATKVGTWEEFRLWNNGDGTFSLATWQRVFVSVAPDSHWIATATHQMTNDARFQLIAHF